MDTQTKEQAKTMKMQPMRRSGAAPPPSGRRADRKQAVPPFSWREQWQATVLLVVVAGFLLFNFAAGLSPTLTGRCLRCVVTGNYHCGWLPSGKHPHERHMDGR